MSEESLSTVLLERTILEQPMPVLDHGYVRYVEHWGSDERIIEAARMSTAKGFIGWDPGPCPVCGGRCITGDEENGFDATEPCRACEGVGQVKGDAKLLAYLYTHHHLTPFEMAGLTIEVQAPIFVFREWHRHRTQSFNEMSSRYVPLPDLSYVPSVHRLLATSKTNRQAGTASGARELTSETARLYLDELVSMYQEQERLYQQALDAGVPKELARLHLPVARYSRMRASANLRNWLGFLTLRLDSAAQWEIRQYAERVGLVVASLYPRTWELFIQGRKAS